MTFTYIGWFCCAIATVLADLRWLRVAQREHYLAGSVTRFARRWWSYETYLLLLAVIAFGAIFASIVRPIDALFAAGIVALGPWGLPLRGKTSPLVWTQRLKKLAIVLGVLQGVVLVVALFVAPAPIGAFVAVSAPIFVDLALKLRAPAERKAAQVFVDKASQRLSSVAPTVVAITGSYGKTSTKQYSAHLVKGSKSVLASPASFNNKAGLSRTINEQLAPGTDIFIAEMGAYGVGEIRELCSFCPPSIGVITAIGPVHLERFGSLENTVKAKSEIFEKVNVAVLNVDDPYLAPLVDQLTAEGKKVWRCGSKSKDLDVKITTSGAKTTVTIKQQGSFTVAALDAPLTNVACAVAVAAELGVAIKDIEQRLANLPVPEHRQETSTNADGVIVIDDTFNANPASVRRGLEVLQSKASGSHRRIVVTPGMVELGSEQFSQNREFAAEAAKVATDFIVVGFTNQKALVKGAKSAGLTPVLVARLPKAVEWVRENSSSGDAVLYANDLPDHFP